MSLQLLSYVIAQQRYTTYTLPSAVKGVKVLFAHDTETALNAAAALVNTAGLEQDRLADLRALDAFVREWGWTGSRRRDTRELEQVRALRPRLRKLWELDEEGVA